MSHPLVANIHRKQPYDVYVGRPRAGKAAHHAPWGNPFLVGQHGTREQVVAMYREWLMKQPHLLARLPELRGKVLGCFCAPLACHADVLAELANRECAGQTSLFSEGR